MSLNAYSADPERATATSAPFTSNAFAAPSSTSLVAATVMNSAMVPPWVVVSRSLRGSDRRRFCSGVVVRILGSIGPRANLARPSPRAQHVGPRQRPVEDGQPDHPFAERDRQQDRHERSDDPCALEEDLVPHEYPTECSFGCVPLHQARERQARELRGRPRRERVDRQQGGPEELGGDERADPAEHTHAITTASSRVCVRRVGAMMSARNVPVMPEPATSAKIQGATWASRSANAMRNSRKPPAARIPIAPIAGIASCGILPRVATFPRTFGGSVSLPGCGNRIVQGPDVP